MTIGEAAQLLDAGRHVRRPCWPFWWHLQQIRPGGFIYVHGTTTTTSWAPTSADLAAADWEEWVEPPPVDRPQFGRP